jgi:endonuclease G
MTVSQTAILNRFSWLMSGFLLGMLCLYSIQPSSHHYEQHPSFVKKRDVPKDGIMRFGNPGK